MIGETEKANCLKPIKYTLIATYTRYRFINTRYTNRYTAYRSL